MRIVLEKEAYVLFSKEAKAKNLTTRELGVQVISDYVISHKLKEA